MKLQQPCRLICIYAATCADNRKIEDSLCRNIFVMSETCLGGGPSPRVHRFRPAAVGFVMALPPTCLNMACLAWLLKGSKGLEDSIVMGCKEKGNGLEVLSYIRNNARLAPHRYSCIPYVWPTWNSQQPFELTTGSTGMAAIVISDKFANWGRGAGGGCFYS